jgi:hypothetical protein
MDTPTLPTYAAEVARGVALLDRQLPGWADRIDPGRLDPQSCDDDTLGQLYGHFDIGLDELTDLPTWDTWHTWAVRHGFACDADVPRSQEWAQLTDAWRAELARRGGEAP